VQDPKTMVRDNHLFSGTFCITILPEIYHTLFCRWRVRHQGREPGSLPWHDGLRQRPHLQGRQGMRLLLRGTHDTHHT
jgi:hypothetical protein